jgi:6-pyruvoyltetrahydropterin/6-carboxytetrahydropterin synthase
LKLTQTFFFDAAHTLNRRINVYDQLKSKNIHGHTYHASISIQGEPDENGMVKDFGQINYFVEHLKYELDHEFLNNIPTLGEPTLENLCIFISKKLKNLEGLCEVSVERKASGDKCTLEIK